jgi:uncharacterized protein (DUF2141 family)
MGMRNIPMTRVMAGIVLSATLVLSAGGALADGEAPPAAPAPPPAVNRIAVEINGLRNAKGAIRCSLFESAAGFPQQPDRAVMRTVAPAIVSGRAFCAFDNVKPGIYAVGYLHDENNNGKMDTNFLGMPSEGYGASNNARGSMGPPKFDNAKFAHNGQTTTQRLKTEY